MRTRERLSTSLLALATAIAILCVGSVFRWTEAIVAVTVGAAICIQIGSKRSFGALPPLVAFLGAAALLTAVQLVPLPHLLVSALQPMGHALRLDGATLAETSPWQAITLDAPGTLRGLCFFVILLGVAWLGLRMTVSSSGRYRVIAIIAACCGAAAIVTGVHELVGADSLYGLYEPQLGRPVVLGPLLNANHLGCLMGVGTMTATGLALYTRQTTAARIGWVAVVITCAIVAVLTRSRGATLALITGAFVTGALVIASRFLGDERRRKPSYLTTVPIAVVAISTIIVIVYASAGGVSKELARTTFDEVADPHSKFAIWRAAGELVEETPWVGVGRGAFEPAITHVHPRAAFATFSHVENEYLQAVVDWGIPGAIVLALLLGWLLVRAIRRWQDGPLIAGAFGALAVIALQSVVDFGVQLLALAIPAVLLLATISYVPLLEAPARKKQALALRGLTIGGLVLAAVALLSSATTSIAEDHNALRGRDKLTLAEIQPAIERHPLDYYGYAIAAQALYRAQDPRAVSLLNHAMRLHPSHSGLHQIAARALLQAGRLDQAAIEYASALRGTNAPDRLIAEIVAQFPPELAATAIPVDIPNFDAVMALLRTLPKSQDLIRLWLVRILQLRPSDLRACDALYAVAAQHRDERAAAEAGARCVDHALDPDAKVALARMLFDKARYAEVAKLLRDVETWRGLVPVRVRGWLILCDAESARSRWDEAKRCLRRLDVSGLVVPETRGEITSRLEKIEQQLRAQAK